MLSSWSRRGSRAAKGGIEGRVSARCGRLGTKPAQADRGDASSGGIATHIAGCPSGRCWRKSYEHAYRYARNARSAGPARLAYTPAPAPSDALLLDAGMKQTLAATRSLGKAGLVVSLAECCGSSGRTTVPPAFWSRWAQGTFVLPDFIDDADTFAAGVLEIVTAHPTRVIVPASDQSISSLRPWRADIERHAPVAMASEAALSVASDKRATLGVAKHLGLAAPRTAVVDSARQLPAALADVGLPAVVKPTVPWSRERGGRRVFSREVLNASEAFEAVDALQRAGTGVLVQELATGRREAVCVFKVGVDVLAEFALSYLRTTPVLGGASVLRESIPMPPDSRLAALTLVDAIGLDGYAEVEFRRDRQGRPLLMEINPRLSGSLELAVRSGVDFPMMLWKWASGQPVEKVEGYRIGSRLRWLSGEGSWLVENLRRPGRPDSVPVDEPWWRSPLSSPEAHRTTSSTATTCGQQQLS